VNQRAGSPFLSALDGWKSWDYNAAVLAVDDQTDCALIRLSHYTAERPIQSRQGVGRQGCLGYKRKNDDGFFLKQRAATLVVTPDPQLRG
jgi:hypothetical protein